MDSHSCLSAATTTAASEATTPPRLVSGASDVETFFGTYRVIARRESEIAVDGKTEGMIAFGDQDMVEENDEERADAAAAAGDFAAVNLGGGSDSGGKRHRTYLVMIQYTWYTSKYICTSYVCDRQDDRYLRPCLLGLKKRAHHVEMQLMVTARFTYRSQR